MILQATIGGLARDFDVLALGDRVFRFWVSSRLVGFPIFKLRSFECSLFKIFFHLWGNGGPNWIREWKLFCGQEEASWLVANRNISAKQNVFVRADHSFADAVKKTPLTGDNRVPIPQNPARKSVFDQLFFPEVFHNFKNKGKTPIGQFHTAGPTQFEQRSVLNFGSSAAGNLSGPLKLGICSCCLTAGHAREVCKCPIRCYVCWRWGHTALNCPDASNGGSKARKFTAAINDKGILARVHCLGHGIESWAKVVKPN